MYGPNSLAANLFTAGYSWGIGARIQDGSPIDFTNGLIEDPRVYNRALSSAEILSLYNDSNIVNGLVANLDFKNTLGSNVPDLSDYNNYGTLINSPSISSENHLGNTTEEAVIILVNSPSTSGGAKLSGIAVESFIRKNLTFSETMTGGIKGSGSAYQTFSDVFAVTSFIAHNNIYNEQIKEINYIDLLDTLKKYDTKLHKANQEDKLILLIENLDTGNSEFKKIMQHEK